MWDSIKSPVWSRIIAKFVRIQFGWVGCGPRLRCAHPRSIQTRYASPHSPLAKLDLEKFGSSRRTKPVGLIESFGAPPQTPGRFRSKNVAGGSAPAKPRSAGGLGEGAPCGGLGAEPPATFLQRSRPGVWGGASVNPCRRLRVFFQEQMVFSSK